MAQAKSLYTQLFPFVVIAYLIAAIGSVVGSGVQGHYLLAILNGIVVISICVTQGGEPKEYQRRAWAYALSFGFTISNLIWNALHIRDINNLSGGWINITLVATFGIMLIAELEEAMRWLKAIKTPFSDPKHKEYYFAYFDTSESTHNYQRQCNRAVEKGMIAFCIPERKTA